MASSAAATELTGRHKVQQDRISAETMAVAIRLWPFFTEDPEANEARWLAAMIALIRRQRRRSAETAMAYALAFRRLELGPSVDPFDVKAAFEPDIERVTTSLMVTGPQELRRQLREYRRETDRPDAPLPPAIDSKIADSMARATMRHVRNGERDTLDDVVVRDRRALGYQRVTDGDPCFWCAMLASRGPVYREDSFAASDARFHGPGNHKVHDGCGCTLEPMYVRNAPWIGRSQEFNDLWYEATAGKSGREAIREFRRVYEGRARPPR